MNDSVESPRIATTETVSTRPLRLAERRALLLAGDLLLVNLATLIALYLGARRSGWPFSLSFLLENFYVFVALTALWWLLASANDLYQPRVSGDLYHTWVTVARVTVQLLLPYVILYFLLPPWSVPRHVMVFFAALSTAFLGLWRSAYVLVFSQSPFRQRALVVGAGWAGQTIVQAIREHLPSQYAIVGFVDDDPQKQDQVIHDVPILGTRRDLPALVASTGASEIILAITHDLHHELLEALLACYEDGVPVVPMNALYEQVTGRVPVEHIGDHWYVALPVDPRGATTPYRGVKRALDMVLALASLILAAPLFFLVAVAIVLDSGRPVFYAQDRVTQGGRGFRLLKFRSMVQGAERDGRAEWAGPDDPRRTRVGCFLRRMHLDELPQLINILRGDMSFIGPRPERPEFVAQLQQHIPFYRTRLAVRPGLGGWAQVHFGYGSSVEDALVKLQYDLYYIKHQSLSLDLLILLKSIGLVLSMRGR